MRTLCRLAVALLVASPLQAQTRATAGPPVASLDSAWASIARTYYDTALINGRWKVVYDSLRTALATADDANVRGGIRALIAVPGQSHFALIPGDAVPLPSAARTRGTPGTTGIDVRYVDGDLMVWRVEAGSAAAAAGIRPGSVFTHLDTMPVDVVRSRLARAFPDSPRQMQMLIAAVAKSQLGGNLGDTVRFTLREPKGRRTQAHALVRGPLTGRTTQFGNLPPMVVLTTHDSVAVGRGRTQKMVPVIHFSAWFPAISQELDAHLFGVRGAPAMILDLRGNPGGVVGMIGGVAGHFADSAVNLGTMYGRGATMTLRANPRVVTPAGVRVPVFTAPLAILVDEFTASSSEFFAAGMQGLGRARVFGETSSGQALPALMARLPNGDVLMHPIADHVDAAGRRVEGAGVVPDVRTPLTRRDVISGRDAALEAARTWLTRTLR